jgi:flagellar hook assembly protein FlgD
MLLSLAMLICAGAGSESSITTHSHTFQSYMPGTSVNYELAQYGPVELTVHDVSGRLVRKLESGPRQRGFHAARWDGTDGYGRVVSAGVYFVRFSAGGRSSTGRLTLVR